MSGTEPAPTPAPSPPVSPPPPPVGTGAVGQTASMTGYAGAAIVLLTWAASQFHLTVPPEVSAALVMLLTPVVHFAALKLGTTTGNTQ